MITKYKGAIIRRLRKDLVKNMYPPILFHITYPPGRKDENGGSVTFASSIENAKIMIDKLMRKNNDEYK